MQTIGGGGGSVIDPSIKSTGNEFIDMLLSGYPEEGLWLRDYYDKKWYD